MYLDIEMDTDILNMKCVSVQWYFFVLSKPKQQFEAQFMKKLVKQHWGWVENSRCF